VIPHKKYIYTKILLVKNGIKKEGCKIMVKDEEYFDFLKSIINCISNGDYYSAKELSNLKLEKIKQKEEKVEKDLKKIKNQTKFNKNIPIEEWNSKDLIFLVKNYSKYVTKKIEETQNIKDLQEETISIEEFIQKI